MAFVPAKCPCCGGEIQIDDSRKEAFCSFCGAKFIAESAICYYNTTNEYHIEHADFHVEDSRGIESRLANAESFLTVHKNYERANEEYSSITNDYSGDWRGWWGVVRALSREFSGVQVQWTGLYSIADDERDYVRELERKDSSYAYCLRTDFGVIKKYAESTFRLLPPNKDELLLIWSDYSEKACTLFEDLARDCKQKRAEEKSKIDEAEQIKNSLVEMNNKRYELQNSRMLFGKKEKLQAIDDEIRKLKTKHNALSQEIIRLSKKVNSEPKGARFITF